MKVLKRELLIYLAILVALSLFMHPERIRMIDSPLQLIHPFLWSFGAYVIVAILRGIVSFFVKLFRKKNRSPS